MVYLFSHFIKLMFHLIYLVRSDEEIILHVIWRAKINQYYCYYGFGSTNASKNSHQCWPKDVWQMHCARGPLLRKRISQLPTIV